MGVERNEGTTAGTTNSVGYVIRGMECDEDGGRLQADKAMKRTEIDQECHGRGHDSATQGLRRGVYTVLKDELRTIKHYDTLLGDDT